MTRDYAKKPRARSGSSNSNSNNNVRPRSGGRGNSSPRSARKTTPPPGPSTWQWLIVVAVTSAFVGFVVYLNAVPPEAPGQARSQPAVTAPAKTVKAAPVAPKTAPREPEYRFYDMLPESEVNPPDVNVYNASKGQRPQFEYILQTGSFRGMDDAQRQKAQIGFLGMRAAVSAVNLDSGDVWYRVEIGPYQSRSLMNSAIDRLVSINIQPMVRKKPLPAAKP